MSIDLEHDTLNDKYYVHDMIDGWLTAEITKSTYYRWKKYGMPISSKERLTWS